MAHPTPTHNNGIPQRYPNRASRTLISRVLKQPEGKECLLRGPPIPCRQVVRNRDLGHQAHLLCPLRTLVTHTPCTEKTGQTATSATLPITLPLLGESSNQDHAGSLLRLTNSRFGHTLSFLTEVTAGGAHGISQGSHLNTPLLEPL